MGFQDEIIDFVEGDVVMVLFVEDRVGDQLWK